MKTFATLNIGDTIFIIKKDGRLFNENDAWGNTYKADWFVTDTVKNIVAESDFIRINQWDSKRELFRVPKTEVSKTFFEGDYCIYFLNESEVTEWKRNFLISKIRQSEESIVDAANRSKKYIESLRKEYYEILNFIEA